MWVDHYNRGRPHAGLGPGDPDPPRGLPQEASSRYRIPQNYSVVTTPIPGGLHHEYGVERFAGRKLDTKAARGLIADLSYLNSERGRQEVKPQPVTG
jgi:hypothetical protein